MKYYIALLSLFVCSMFAASAETVVNENPGRLGDLLKNMGLLEAEELRIEGVLNEDDIWLLRSLASESGHLKCIDLKSCKISAHGVENVLPEDAFKDACRLESLQLPSNLIKLSYKGFWGCSSLQHFEIPRDVMTFDPYHYQGTSALLRITVEEGNQYFVSDGMAVYTIDGEEIIMFPSGYKGKYTIPEGVQTVGYLCFYGCNGLTELNLPQSLECVKQDAFDGCSSLKTFCYPDNVKLNYGGLDNNTSLETIVFGRGMVECWEGLDGCSNLKDVYAFMPVPFHAKKGYSGHCSFCYMPNPANVTLHVLPGTAEMYRKMEGWQWFSNIVEMSEDEVTGIQSILQDGSFSQGAEVLTTNVKPIYDFLGRRTSNTDRGIHIKNGRKVYE